MIDGEYPCPPSQFYLWYKTNASAARNADKTQTVGLFATKLVKGLTGFTFRMEALRIIIAHAQAQVLTRSCNRVDPNCASSRFEVVTCHTFRRFWCFACIILRTRS